MKLVSSLDKTVVTDVAVDSRRHDLSITDVDVTPPLLTSLLLASVSLTIY